MTDNRADNKFGADSTDNNSSNANELLDILGKYEERNAKSRNSTSAFVDGAGIPVAPDSHATVENAENVSSGPSLRKIPSGGHFSSDESEDFVQEHAGDSVNGAEVSAVNGAEKGDSHEKNTKTKVQTIRCDFDFAPQLDEQEDEADSSSKSEIELLRKKYKQAKHRNRERKKKGSVTVSLVKALIYITAVILLSFFVTFGFFGIWPGIVPMANDVFAFVKDNREVIVDVDSGMSTSELASLLEERGIIEEKKVFEFYVMFKYEDANKEKLEKQSNTGTEIKPAEEKGLVSSIFQLGGQFIGAMFFGSSIDEKYDNSYIAGEHKLNSNMNYDQILSELLDTKYTREEITVTVPEGYGVDQIIELLVSNGIGEKDEYVKVINEYPFKHEFVQELEDMGYPENRKYRLEGYLFPDTYIFYEDAEEVTVINKMLNNFSAKFWDEYERTYKSACDEAGFTFDEVITFASIVQFEGKNFSDYECIAQVFTNRFKSSSYPFMESCATVQYFLDERHPVLTAEDIAIDNPYNTYLYKGLPPGAICNPGLDAIEATIYPDMPSEVLKEFDISKAYFFNSDLAGNIYYAQTESQHSRNKAKADKVNEQVINGTYVEEEEDEDDRIAELA